MTTTPQATTATQNPTVTSAELSSEDLKLEVVRIGVTDVDRSKDFYTRLGWRLDADISVGDTFRVVQMTPPGSQASVSFGVGVTEQRPGVDTGYEIVVSDIEKAAAQLAERGATVGAVFHGSPFDKSRQLPGPEPTRASYQSYATFSDPDGNRYLLQEVTNRLPGRVAGATTYASVADVKGALIRAAAAHGEHEARTGEADADWPSWYAAYMVAEQSGAPLPE